MFTPSFDDADPMTYAMPPFSAPFPPRGFRRWGARGPFPPFMMARHFGPWGRGPRGGGRMFGRGDLKFALLGLLLERPRHGYEMIKELEQRAGGFYTPSAGAVYPTLQLLEDRGWVTVEMADGKKIYAITDAGREALNEQRNRGAEEGPFGGPPPWFWGSEEGGPGWHGHHGHGPWDRHGDPKLREAIRNLVMDARATAMLVRQAILVTRQNPDRLAQLHDILKHTKAELEAFIKAQEGAQPTPSEAAKPTGGSVEQV